MTPAPVTRREALLTGRRRYVGRPCKIHGAGALRYTTNSGCVACSIASALATKQRERSLAATADMDEEA